VTSRERIGPDFAFLWTGQTISLIGTQVSALAVPLTAAISLDASPGQMGLLGAAQWLPFLLVGLPAGVWVDRRSRRRTMIAADIGRALSVGVIPAAVVLGWLSLPLLYGCVFATGLLHVFFDLALQSYVPILVGPERLIRANSRIQASMSAAEVGGPGIAGFLTELLSAPVALVADAASYLASAVSIAAIRAREQPPETDASAESLRESITDGLRTVARDPILRAMAVEAGAYNLFDTAIFTLLVLFATRELGISPGGLGLVLAMGAIGSVAGAITVERRSSSWIVGKAMVRAYAGACLTPLLIPAAAVARHASTAILIGTFAVLGFSAAIVQVYVWSVRQTIVAPSLLGRMNSAYRFIVSGTVPVGALFGGFLGASLGVTAGIGVAAVGISFAMIPILRSPIPRLRAIPAHSESDRDHPGG
jgi:MFS family permease